MLGVGQTQQCFHSPLFLLFSLILYWTISSPTLATHFLTLLLALLPSPHTRSSPRPCPCPPASSKLSPPEESWSSPYGFTFQACVCIFRHLFPLAWWTFPPRPSCWNLGASISWAKYIIFLLTLSFFPLFSFSDNTTSRTPCSLSSKP